MKKRNLVLIAALSLVALAGCSTTENKTIVSYKDNKKITQEDLNTYLNTAYGETGLQNLIVSNILEEKYGKEVTDEDVDKAYDAKFVDGMTDENKIATIKANGYSSEKDFKNEIRNGLLLQASIKADKDVVNDEAIEALWKKSIEIGMIATTDQAKAEEAESLLKQGQLFGTVAAAYSEDQSTALNKGEVGWISTESTTTLPSEVMEAAKALKDSEFSSVISTDYGYYIIFMYENPANTSSTWKNSKDEITDLLVQEKTSDTSFTAGLIKDLLDEYDVKVEDDDYKEAVENLQNAATNLNKTTSSDVTATEESSQE